MADQEGETSEKPTQSIHNIVMTTEEAVNLWKYWLDSDLLDT